MPPGRPKRWKQLAMDVLAMGTAQRIEGTQTDERSDNKMWLVKHLEVTKNMTPMFCWLIFDSYAAN